MVSRRQQERSMRSRLEAMERDRISDLPQPILHQILSHLSQNDAVKTCVLSKSWRYLWYGRPNVEFCKNDFNGTLQNFISVIEDTLTRYRNQNLSIQKIVLKIPNPVSASFSDRDFEDWIRRLEPAPYFDLPSLVFNCESLREIHLERCNLGQINSTDHKVLFTHLQTLRLHGVSISNETFERIMSSCALIEEVSLIKCWGLNTIKVNYGSLKNFEIDFMFDEDEDENDPRIEIADLSRVETINITNCRDWFEDHYNNIFTRLKSLRLSYVNLTAKSVDSFSCNFPYLEELELSDWCDNFPEFKVSSRSIKRLAIDGYDLVKVSIDAPNMLEFEYKGYEDDFPTHISFTTTLNKWKSKIVWRTNLDAFEVDYISKWLHKLDQLLKVLSSRSEISLHIVGDRSEDYRHISDDVDVQVIVKHLELCLGSQLCSDFCVQLKLYYGTIVEEWNSKN